MSPSLISALVALSFVACSARHLGKREDDYTRLMTGRYDPFHNECEFAEDDRQQCGRPTYDEDECHKRGCCYQTCPGCAQEIPWCFLAHRMLREECQVSYEQKEDCGYYGIMEGECYMRGCCWAPSPLTNDPPCFKGVTVKLVNGDRTNDSLSGRVEIKHNGVWGTVCDDNFDQNAADVVCRSLGFEYAEAKGYAQFGEGSGQILLDGMRCTGDEERLEDCSHNGWGSHDCSHSEDSGAICTNAEPDIYSYQYATPDPYYYNYGDYTDYYDYYDTYDYTGDYGDYGSNGDYSDYETGTEAPTGTATGTPTTVDEEYPWYRAGRPGGRGRNGFAGKPSKRHATPLKRSPTKKKHAKLNRKMKAQADKAVEKQLLKLNKKGQPFQAETDETKHAMVDKKAKTLISRSAGSHHPNIDKKTLAMLKTKIHIKRDSLKKAALKKRQTKKSFISDVKKNIDH